MDSSFLLNIAKGITKKAKKIFVNEYGEFGLSYFKLKKLKHQGYNQPGSLRLKEHIIKFNHPPELLHSLKEIFVDNIYKIKLMDESPKIIDCGSNIGLSIVSLKLQYPNSTIIAFEPDKINFNLLQENTKLFSNITLVNKAVDSFEGEIEFEMSGTLGSNSFQNNNIKNIEKVKTARLKSYLQTHIHFLKIDIEGAEYNVLMDCKEELKNIDNLFLEYHGSFYQNKELNEMLELLTISGFLYYIKEADNVYPTPFCITEKRIFDMQLNIFAFKKNQYEQTR